MDFLKIFDQKIDLRDIKEFSNNVRGFHMTKCKNILLNCCWEITLGIEKISMKSTDFCQKRFLTILILGKSIGLIIERSLKKCLNFEGIIFLRKSKYYSFILLIANN